MHIRDWFFYKKGGLLQRMGRPQPSRTAPFCMPEGSKPSDYRARAKSQFAEVFFEHEGRAITKWIDYLDVYDRHFAKFRGTPVRMLEVGVLYGGSLELWRKYLGPDAVLFGIDITPECAQRVDPPNQVRIGSQADADFLRGVVAEMGGLDIVLDDGSHRGRDQYASFKTLFPLIADGGVYAIEDVHTSYWPGDSEGGYKRRGTAIELVKQLLDDMHAWFHSRREQLAAKEAITGIHAYESVVFIDKGRKLRPLALEQGRP
ncbi:MAG: class I SAM-dependent methyltransferase [Sphingomicrobium sp.]